MIRDDGSSDSTVSNIREYSQKVGRISLITNESQKHGWRVNFLRLLYTDIKASYVMFCDQDDIWFSNKMSLFLNEMEVLEQKGNCNIVYADMKVIDAEGNVIKSSFGQIYDMTMSSLRDCFFTQ